MQEVATVDKLDSLELIPKIVRTRVCGGLMTYHLVSKHEHGFERELALAVVE